MHRIYRQLIGVIASIILMAIACNKCRHAQTDTASQGWTPLLESQMHEIFYMQSARLTTNDAERNAFADCCVSKIKEMFPNGLSQVDMNMSDSVKMAVMKMGANCAMNFKSNTLVWTPDEIEQLKLTIYSYAETKMLPQKMKKEYVNCVTDAIVYRYSKGMQAVNKDSLKAFINAQRTKCLKMLANRYGKLKTKQVTPDSASAR